jgi:predicted transcriptional regulator
MNTSIQVEKEIKARLDKLKNHPRETYNDVLARLIKIVQDDDVLSPVVIKNIEEGIADIKAGRVYSSAQVKKKLGLK